jgi:bacterioferritin-associated ferredoxin
MIVCVCHAVNDRKIKEVIQNGARSVSAIARSCRAGTDCGACCSSLRNMLTEAGVRSGPCHEGQPRR